MGGSNFVVSGAAITDLLILEQCQAVERYLVDTDGKTRDPGLPSQLIETARPIGFADELDIDRLHTYPSASSISKWTTELTNCRSFVALMLRTAFAIDDDARKPASNCANSAN